MLSGDNSILQKATEAKEQTELANAREIAKITHMEATIGKEIPNVTRTAEETIINELNDKGYTVTVVPISGTTINGVSLKDGENSITTLKMKTTDSTKTLTVSLNTTDGEDSSRYFVTVNGRYHEMYITNDSVTIEDEALTTLPTDDNHPTLTLALTGLNGLVKLNNESVPISGTIEVKDGDKIKITPNANMSSGNISLSMTNIEEITTVAVAININVKSGLIVNNYNKGKTDNNQDLVWRLLYVGKMDETDPNEEEHVYIISDQEVKRDQFSNHLSGYNGTSDFISEIQDTNGIKKKDYFPAVQNGLLSTMFKNGTVLHTRTSNLTNIQATEYLLDSVGVWNNEYLDSGVNENGYGLYAIGCPTLELLSKSFVQGGMNAISYRWDTTNNRGYVVSNYKTKNSIPGGLWLQSTTWIACPSSENNNYVVSLLVDASNHRLWTVDRNPVGGKRVVICLKSNYTVIADTAHSGQYKIIEK